MYYVLTYNTPHRKTQDLLFNLKAIGYSNIKVIAMPFKYRKTFKPVIQHRPSNPIEVSIDDLCENLNYELVKLCNDELNDYCKENPPNLILIGGAGILPKEIVKNWTVVNAHPGYLPIVRGLDALKWAIYEKNPIGVTSHVVSEETDAGFLIKREIVPIYQWDTFHSVAYRQYEMEIRMLADSIEDFKKIDHLELIGEGDSIPHKRMPNEKEKELYKKFNDMLNKNTFIKKA